MAELYKHLLQTYMDDPGKLEADFSNDLVIVNPIQDAAHQASVYMKWAALATFADSKYRAHKKRLELEIYPHYYDHYRSWLESQGEKATEKRVDTLVGQNEEYRKEVQIKMTLGHISDLLKKVQDAFWQRKDMLQVCVGKYTKEMHAEPISPEQKQLRDWAGTQVRDDRSLEDLEKAAIQKLGR